MATPRRSGLKADRKFASADCTTTALGRFEMDDHGWFRVAVKDTLGNWHSSHPTYYQGIASIEVDGVQFIGVSAYFFGVLPHECVLKVTKD